MTSDVEHLLMCLLATFHWRGLPNFSICSSRSPERGEGQKGGRSLLSLSIFPHSRWPVRIKIKALGASHVKQSVFGFFIWVL
ncbi:unnamed protein product [Nyctereutes procyonoides]|uniref:(raccoon dog) hypothetical protein n=1 Tax=Nyctereutes procyonoides TaxID=34880 RepID=A0A811ZJ39_NYCPR|nr:unnamed protein product [Nyctereutes procyonoides]